MSQPTTNASAIVLKTASQWHSWLSIIEANAKQAQVWDPIDPAKTTEPAFAEPVLPKRSALTEGDKELQGYPYIDLMAQFNINIKRYEEKVRILTQTLASI